MTPDQYIPVFDIDCSECDNSPCVAMLDDEGNLRCTRLCGICFFGDRIMIDPDLWNDLRGGME